MRSQPKNNIWYFNYTNTGVITNFWERNITEWLVNGTTEITNLLIKWINDKTFGWKYVHTSDHTVS